MHSPKYVFIELVNYVNSDQKWLNTVRYDYKCNYLIYEVNRLVIREKLEEQDFNDFRRKKNG